jgi:hypothetical protein
MKLKAEQVFSFQVQPAGAVARQRRENILFDIEKLPFTLKRKENKD